MHCIIVNSTVIFCSIESFMIHFVFFWKYIVSETNMKILFAEVETWNMLEHIENYQFSIWRSDFKWIYYQIQRLWPRNENNNETKGWTTNITNWEKTVEDKCRSLISALSAQNWSFLLKGWKIKFCCIDSSWINRKSKVVLF